MPAVARLIADYDAFVDAIRERVDEMGMTRLEFDHQAGMQEGYSEKILEPKHVKIFGMKSLGDTLGAIGCKLLLVEDSEQTAKMRARITPRRRPVRQAAAGGDAIDASSSPRR
jgi:predicted transcriptional regulator